MVYVMLADGFEITEALTTVDVLKRGKLQVKTVSIENEYVKSSCDIVVKSDILADEIDFNDIDCVVLPGGMPGTLNLEKSDFVQKVVDFCIENDKYLCAICAAPSILAHKGILDNKNATCYPGFEVNSDKVNYKSDLAVADGKIITGKGAGCTIEFALLITEKLASKEIAQQVKESMQCAK